MKKTITLLTITLAFISLSNTTNAQTPTWAWAKDTSSIAIGGMTTDASGNVYVSNDFGTVFLEKYDNTGNKIWAKAATGAQKSPPAVQTYPNGIALDPSGNIFVSGFFTSDSIIIETTVIKRVSLVDMYIAKYDKNGKLTWAKSAAIGNVGNVGYHVATDALGNAIVVGSYSAATITIGTTTFTNPCTAGGGAPSMLVVKYDGTNGNVLWAKSSFASISTSYCYSVATDASNNVYVGGVFSKTGNPGSSIVKYNSLGDTLWTQANGGWYVNTDATGNLYSGFDIAPTVKKYNSATGAILWSAVSTGNTDNAGVGTQTDAAGNVYYAGTFNSTSITFGTFTLAHDGTGSDADIFIVKYDNSGTPIWAIAVGGTGYDALEGFTVDAGGNVYVGGFFLSPSLTFGTTTLNVLGVGYGTFFARLGDIPTAINELNGNNSFNIYPNPAYGSFVVESNITEKQLLQVFDITGKLMFTEIRQNGKTIINANSLAHGIYNVRVSGNESVVNKRLVIIE